MKAIDSDLKDWCKRNHRKMKIYFEPSGALVTLSGYLVTQVMSVCERQDLDCQMVTVDSSAWNLSPWHKQV